MIFNPMNRHHRRGMMGLPVESADFGTGKVVAGSEHGVDAWVATMDDYPFPLIVDGERIRSESFAQWQAQALAAANPDGNYGWTA